MQFIPDGPEIPNALLQAHEGGRVVFFCGAGISYPAGLMDFKHLAYALAAKNLEPFDQTEKNSIENNKPLDEVIGRYERRVQGGRLGRRHLPSILQPDLNKRRALTTHLALLKLGRSQQIGLRLITTNFDTLFERAAKRYNLDPFTVYPDPPARRHWEGVVHLHGRMPENPSADELERLILSDGDFGRAYLTEGWASQFAARLFREFTVCFVGYSINDPVLRYMTAAHALEGGQEIFAFASYKQDDKASSTTQQWREKHVTPIVYHDTGNHRMLHKSLHIWASIYRDGSKGKERLIVHYAHRRPEESSRQNDFIGRLLWAISDPSGRPAKRFAEINPVPPLEWLLEAFTDRSFECNDLPRVDVTAKTRSNDRLRFSPMKRPAPFDHSDEMQLVSDGRHGGRWDERMRHLARWLLRHLDDPRLVLWIAKSGGQLHHHWKGLIEDELNRLADLVKVGEPSELNAIRRNAPNAIPRPLMRTLWRLVLSGRLESPHDGCELQSWLQRLKSEGLTTTLRLELRDLLAPRVRLKPLRWSDPVPTGEAKHLSQLVDWDLVLASDDVHTSLLSNQDDDHWKEALPLVLEDIQQLLRDAIALWQELDQNAPTSDPSRMLLAIHSSLPESSFQAWVNLILLLRNSWLAIHDQDPTRARLLAQRWFTQPEPTFQRLAVYAASQDGCLTPEEWVEWLLVDDARLLWATATEQEVHNLLELQGRHVTKIAQERLETAILAGPPKALHFSAGGDPKVADRWIWVRLAKLNESGLPLGEVATARFLELSPRFPSEPHAVREQAAPRNWQLLIPWLTTRDLVPGENPYRYVGRLWQEVCGRHPLNSCLALSTLAGQEVWLTPHWRSALNTWSTKKGPFRRRIWRYAAPQLQMMAIPDPLLLELAQDLSQWLESVSQPLQEHEEILKSMCQRLLKLPSITDTGLQKNRRRLDCAETNSRNNPIGRVTQALIHRWLAREPEDKDRLPADLEPFFTWICDCSIDQFRHGRYVLATMISTLFGVDEDWTKRNLIPLFSWTNSAAEARALWQGFLYSRRLSPSLLLAIKTEFLDTAAHYNELGQARDRFAAVLTRVALHQPEVYSVDEFCPAFAALPQRGLEAAAQALYEELDGAGDQREAFWDHRVKPVWEAWPKSANRVTPQISEYLALLVIASGAKFPDALHDLYACLGRLERPHIVVQRLRTSDLCNQFPKDALRLIALVVDQDRSWRGWQPSLRQCLEQIRGADPKLELHCQYKQLWRYSDG